MNMNYIFKYNEYEKSWTTEYTIEDNDENFDKIEIAINKNYYSIFSDNIETNKNHSKIITNSSENNVHIILNQNVFIIIFFIDIILKMIKLF